MSATQSVNFDGESNNRPLLMLAIGCMFSIALGWRIRGQFGHEVGASIAGALGGMAVVLFSGRSDWLARIHSFAMFGALGWGFGGSISYMKVVGYTHSSDSMTVLYGFAGMLLIGFMWSALGAAGTALPAVLDQDRLRSLYAAVAAVFIGWFLWEIGVDWMGKSITRSNELGVRVEELTGLAKFDVDWQEATVAIVSVLVLAGLRRRLDFGTSFVLYLAIGWWVVFAILVMVLGLRLNPPRGDNWAGCLGVVVGLFAFCLRQKLNSLAQIAIVAGLFGSAGFCIGQTIKLTLYASGMEWDFHAVMECIHGAFFGVALAIAFRPLLNSKAPNNGFQLPSWAVTVAIGFVAWMIPYLNIRRSPGIWLKNIEKLPSSPFGISLVAGLLPSRGWVGWFDSIWLLLGLAFITLRIRHRRRPVKLIPESSTGQGQLLYVLFVWIITVMSFVHEFANYKPTVLAIQWWITLNAVICTFVVLAFTPDPVLKAPPVDSPINESSSRAILVYGLILAIASVCDGWGTRRLINRDEFAKGFYMDHIRFGPKNTNDIR